MSFRLNRRRTITSARSAAGVPCRHVRAWRKTRMANVVRDPKVHPEAIIPDLSQARSARDVHAGRHRVRLRQQVEAALLHESGRRLLSARRAVGRHAQQSGGRTASRPNTDWWVPFYPADNMQRPTGPLCDGCHSVNYDIADEDRHRVERRLREVPRPGQRRTSRSRRATNIVNPARLDSVHANDICIQCHSQGQPLTNPIEGRYYDWPVGFHAGLDLKDFWQLEEHKLGRDDVHALRRRHGAQEPDAGQRLRAERDVHARRHLLQLPRRARHAEQRRPDQAGERHLPDVPRPEVAERSARARRSSSTRIIAPAAPATSASAATCRRSSRRSPT